MSVYGKPEVNERAFRPVRTRCNSAGKYERTILPVHLKPKDGVKVIGKVVYRENLGIWMLTDFEGPGLVTFFDAQPPVGWTSATITRVNESSAVGKFDEINQTELLSMYPDASLETLGVQQLRVLARENMAELVKLIPEEQIIMLVGRTKIKDILETIELPEAELTGDILVAINAVSNGIKLLEVQVTGKCDPQHLMKIRHKANGLRSDVLGLSL